jgi:DNA-binding NarL/FixJ family response regulator
MTKDQQIGIVTHLSNGLKSKAIGKVMKLSDRTIDTYVWRMQKQYDCKTIAHLVASFLRNKLIK